MACATRARDLQFGAVIQETLSDRALIDGRHVGFQVAHERRHREIRLADHGGKIGPDAREIVLRFHQFELRPLRFDANFQDVRAVSLSHIEELFGDVNRFSRDGGELLAYLDQPGSAERLVE